MENFYKEIISERKKHNFYFDKPNDISVVPYLMYLLSSRNYKEFKELFDLKAGWACEHFRFYDQEVDFFHIQ